MIEILKKDDVPFIDRTAIFIITSAVILHVKARLDNYKDANRDGF